jgi:hypothetical protein
MTFRIRSIAACIVVPLLAGTVYACRDITPPQTDAEREWAEAGIVALEIKTESRSISAAGVVGLPTMSRRQLVPIERFTAIRNSGAWLRKGSAPPTIRQFRAPNGRLLTVGSVFAESGQPKRLYLFQDGKLLLVTSPKYRRLGNGWVMISARTTVFDERGKPIYQSDSRGAPSQLRDGEVRRASADATIVRARSSPASLIDGDEYADKPCAKELQEFKSKTAQAALASTAYITAFTLCLQGDLDACARIPMLSIPLLSTAEAALSAWKAWRTCEDNANTSSSGGGTGTSLSDADTIEFEEQLQTVQEFIEKAELDGRYACVDDGNLCQYWAE